MEGKKSRTQLKRERYDEAYTVFLEHMPKVGRTNAYYIVCQECNLSYATVVDLVKEREQ